MSRRELAIAILLVMGLLSPLIEIPIVNAIIPQDQTISIVDTHDDKWTTGTGSIGIDSWLVHVLDPGYDVTSWTIFRDVEINNWEPLKNATLRLYTGNTLDFDKESIITIYGMKVDELQNILPIGPSYAVSVPTTDHYVNFNTSQFYGPSKWWDIDVTAIVEELIRAHNWDGDGLTSGDIGDAIGFVMYGVSGHDVRYFVDYRSDPALSAQLVIHWNHQPPLHDPPSPDPEFIEQYGNYTIWREIGIWLYPTGPVEYVYTNGFPTYNMTYDVIEGVGPFTIREGVNQFSTGPAHQKSLVRTPNGTLYALLKGGSTVLVTNSTDGGETWSDSKNVATLPGMGGGNPQEHESMAVDSNDTVYIVWTGQADGWPQSQVWCVNYTDGWGTPVRISTYVGMNGQFQQWPMVAVNSNDTVYVVWDGKATGFTKYMIWCVNYTDGWGYPVRINLGGDMATNTQQTPTVMIDSMDRVHVVWAGTDTGIIRGVYYANYTTEWKNAVLISTAPGMANKVQLQSSIAVDPYDNLHVVWYGKSDSHPDFDQIWYVNYTTEWGTPIRISTYTGMGSYAQSYPSMHIEIDYDIHVLWDGKATGYLDFEKIWYSKHTTAWPTPTPIKPIGKNRVANLRWSRFPSETGNGSYFIADLNGSVVIVDLDDLDDAYDWIDEEQGYDPLDPEPPVWEGSPVAFTRFRMRLYLLIIGYGCVWGPIWFFCWRRPSGYYICGGALVMLMGLGLLIQIVYV